MKIILPTDSPLHVAQNIVVKFGVANTGSLSVFGAVAVFSIKISCSLCVICLVGKPKERQITTNCVPNTNSMNNIFKPVID
jgi:hypothetical protein